MKNKIMIVVVVMIGIVTGAVVWADESKYQIGPGDVLEISVWRDESLAREVVVPPDGYISYPLIGDIDVSGF